MTRNEGLVNFGKQAATSLASTAIGGIGPTEGAFNALEAGQKVGLSLGRQVGQNLSSGLINSIEYSSEDGFGWDGEVLTESMVGKQAISGYMGTIYGGSIQYGMEDTIRGTIGKDLLHAQTTARTAGNLARMGMDLAVTGNTGINLLNANGVGLFEMNFDLEKGISGKIGMGGYDMSAGTIMSAINGMSTYKTSRDILNQGFNGDEAVAMRMLASYGADETDERFEQLMNGEAEFTIEEGDGNAKTEQDENGRISMRIDSQEGDNGDLLTGIALIHEAFRNGLDDGEIGQQQETANAVINHTIAAKMVGQGYGMSSLSDILNSEGGIQKLAEHAVGNYDWSADYWKLMADGNIVFDGKKDLYDENGDLLRKYEGSGNGGWAASLAEHLGIGKDEANQLMIDAGFYYRKDENTFVDGDGNSALLNDNMAIQTENNFKARYFLQRDYIDNVEQYGWSMEAATNAAFADAETEFMTALQRGTMTPEIAAQYEAASALQEFGAQYDAALNGGVAQIPFAATEGLLDRNRYERYSQADIGQAFGQIRDGWSLDNNNPMYSLLGNGNLIDPVEGRHRTSVFSHYAGSYRSGELHGWQGGLAIDFATAGQNHPLYTTQIETLLLGSNTLGWDNPNDTSAGYGYNLRTRTDDFAMIYGHLQSNTYASNQLSNLIQSGQATDLYRFSLPPGYQFGNVGNTGNSYGEHLHWEFRPLW